MMENREIKFRAWGLEEMHYNINICDGVPFTSNDGYYEHFSDREIDNGIIMQYTGLKDKNGVEIYEGDVILRNGHKRIVIFHDASFLVMPIGKEVSSDHVKAIRDGWHLINFTSDIEVIGNIHEHKNLLNDGE